MFTFFDFLKFVSENIVNDLCYFTFMNIYRPLAPFSTTMYYVYKSRKKVFGAFKTG